VASLSGIYQHISSSHKISIRIRYAPNSANRISYDIFRIFDVSNTEFEDIFDVSNTEFEDTFDVSNTEFEDIQTDIVDP
jgi:hypothetical protein